MWVECAPGSIINPNGTISQRQPPTLEELNEWLQKFSNNSNLRDAVWHRYILTRIGRQKFNTWLARSWFFTNATREIIDLIYTTILDPE